MHRLDAEAAMNRCGSARLGRQDVGPGFGNVLVALAQHGAHLQRFAVVRATHAHDHAPAASRIVLDQLAIENLAVVVDPETGNRPLVRFQEVEGTALEVDDVAQAVVRRVDRKSTRLNSSHYCATRMPSSALKQKN